MRKAQQVNYQGYRIAGIRLTEELLPEIEAASSDAAVYMFKGYQMFDKAHVVMLTEENLIPREDAVLMLTSLREMEAKGIDKERREAGGGRHSGEQYLVRQTSEEIGGKIHLGRSSGDLDAVAEKIKQRDELITTMETVNAFRSTLLEVAKKHVDTIMPGYTHGQHAQPLTLAHQILAWAAVLERDFARLISLYRRVNTSPAGAAIMTGSDFPLNRHRTAELMGFDEPCANTLDAIHSHDTLMETFAVISILHSNVARWADDLIMWNFNEIGMIELPDRFCGTSSIMMQKKNPYALEQVKGAASNTIGGLIALFFAEKGPTALPILERCDFSQPSLWHAFANVIRGIQWMTMIIPAMKVKKKLMRQRAGAFWAQATDIAGALVREKGVSFRIAHQIVGILVRICYERGIKPSDVTTELLDEAAVEYTGQPMSLDEGALRRALDPVEFVKARRIYGGPAPEETLKRIPDFAERLTQDIASLDRLRKQRDEAAQMLEQAIDSIVGV